MAINRNVYHLFMKDGWNVEIVAPMHLNFPSGRKASEPRRESDPLIHFLKLNGNNPRTYLFEGLEKILDEKKPRTVLLDNDPVSRLAILTGKWCKKNNARLYCISNENLPIDILSSIKRRGWKTIPNVIAKRFLLINTKKILSGVFTLSNDGKQIFINEGYKQVEWMPLGFDPAHFHPDQNAREIIRVKLGLTTKVIAYFGRLTKEKGVHLLIKALGQLNGSEWLLMMDNFDEYASDYNKEIHKLLKEVDIMNRVVFINPSHYEIANYMNAVDLVVIPSVSSPYWKEQYGRVAAESMACGKLVVASDSGALPQLINKYGILFPEGDLKALKTILFNFLSGRMSEYNLPDTKEIANYALRELSIDSQKKVLIQSFKKSTTKNNS